MKREKVKIAINPEVINILKGSFVYTLRTGHKTSGNPGQYESRWTIGDVIRVFKDACIEPFCTIASGKDLFECGSFSSVASPLPLNTKIGRFSSIGPGCESLGYRHPVEAVSMANAVFNSNREHVVGYFDYVEKRDGKRLSPDLVSNPQGNDPIVIGNDVWIGKNVTIKGGVKIGDGAVIASHSIVNESVNPYEVVAGSPAKFKRLRFSEEIVSSLLESEWWNYELSDLYPLGFSNPERFLENFFREKDNLRPYVFEGLDVSKLIEASSMN